MKRNDAEIRDPNHLKVLFQQIPGALALLCGPEFVLEMANAEYLQMVGRSDILGKTLLEAIPELEQQAFPSILKTVFETGNPYRAREVPAQLRRNSDRPDHLSTIYVDLSYSRVLDTQGAPYGIFVFASDVTEKVLAKRAVQFERQKLESVFSSLSASLALLKGVDGVYEKANDSYHNLFNGRKLLGKPILEALPELRGQKFPDLVAKVFTTGETYTEVEAVAYLSRTADSPLEKRFFDQSYSRITDPDGDNHYVLIQAIDVTARVNAVQALAESERQFRRIADLMPQVVWTARPDGVLDYTNERWTLYSGSSQPAEWLAFVHPEDIDRAVETWQESLKTSQPYQIEFRLRRASDHAYRWFLIRAHAATDSEGRIERWFGTCTDIEEQKAALAERSNFISIASHELKTPLTSLKLQTQSMRRNFENKRAEAFGIEKVRALIDNNEKQVNRLIRLVDDMLDFSKIELGKLSLMKEPVDLREIVSEVYDRLKEQIDSTGAKSQVSGGDKIMVFVDRFRIEQVVTNFLTNAIRYGQRRPIGIEVSCQSERAFVSVSDRGIGIAPENLERVFKRFERAVSASEVSGLGLGLFISKEIIEAHNGRIFATSILGEGSTFTFELPTMVNK